MLIQTLKQAKKVIVAIVGFTLVALGILLFVTPGPGWAVIFLGLTVLSAEFVWARRLLKRLKKTGAAIAETIVNTLNGHSTMTVKPPPEKPQSDQTHP